MKYCVLICVKNANNATACIDAVLQQANKNTNVYVCGKVDASVTNLYSGDDRVCFIHSDRPFLALYEEALNEIVKTEFEWVWCLNSDLIPERTALPELLKAAKTAPKAGYFAGLIKHNDKTVYAPTISSFSINSEPRWAEFASDDLIRIATARMDCVFLATESIRKLGVPNADSINGSSKFLSLVSGKYGAGYYATKCICIIKNAPIAKEAAPSPMKPTSKVCAIVVTYNRKQLLSECISALLKQTYSNFDIFIIDNGSTDGTYDTLVPFLSDRIKYYNTGSNLGGAGGFYYGMKIAYEQKYDWLWIMDDDVIPSPTALAELIAPTKDIKNVSFFASSVYSPKGEAMNTPEISKFSTNGYRFWYAYLDRGLVRLAHATFVSLLINRNAIAKCGLPCKDYFIWGDDTEYTMRIIGRYGAAYIVGKSKVVHKRENASTLSIFNETNPNRIKMYYYMIRNTLLNAKTYFGKNSYNAFLKQYLKDCFKIAVRKGPYRRLKIKTILKAIYDFKAKHYDTNSFDNRTMLYGQEKIVATIIGDCLPNNRDPFCTVRNVPLSLFAKGDFVDSRVRFCMENDEVIELQNEQINKLSPLAPTEKLVIDIDSATKPICVVNHGDKVYYLNEKASFVTSTEEMSVISFQTIDPCDLSEAIAEDLITEFLQKILTRYKQENIILVSPKDKRNKAIYTLFKTKLPYATTIESINELI